MQAQMQTPLGFATTPRSTWQDPLLDQAVRSELTQQIFAIFSRKSRGSQAPGWGARLTQFVHRLEHELYNSARCREEYISPETLEHRLQYVARQLNVKSSSSQQHSSSSTQGGMVPTPGMNGPQGPGFVPNSLTASSLPQDPGQGMSAAGAAGVSSPTMELNHGFTGKAANQDYTPPQCDGVLPSGAPLLLRNGVQRESSSYGMLPNPQAPNGAPPPHSLSSFNGMSSGQLYVGNSGQPAPGMQQASAGFQPGPAYQPSGMVPVNATGGQWQSAPPPLPQTSPALLHPGPQGLAATGHMNTPLLDNQLQGQPAGLAPASSAPGSSAQGPDSSLNDGQKTHYVQKQQRWLLFLRHCAKCKQTETECQLQQQCKFGKQLWQHILHCTHNSQCDYPRCTSSKDLLKHHQKCQSPQCPICAPVKEYVRKTQVQQQAGQQQQQQLQQQQLQQQSTPPPQPPQPPPPMQHGMVPTNGMVPVSGMVPTNNMGSTSGMMQPGGMMPSHGMVPVSSSMMPHGGMVPVNSMMQPTGMLSSGSMMPSGNSMMPSGNSMMPNGMMPTGMVPNGMMTAGMVPNGMAQMSMGGFLPGSMGMNGMGQQGMDSSGMLTHGMGSNSLQPGMVPSNMSNTGLSNSAMYTHPGGNQKRSHGMLGSGYGSPGMTGMVPSPTLGPPGFAAQPSEPQPKRPRTDNEPIITKNTGTSLLETFTAEEIRAHGQAIHAAQGEHRSKQAPPLNASDACKVCECTRLLYEPPVLYCTSCAQKIKRGQTFYATPASTDKNDVRGCWCHPCFSEAKSERIAIPGLDSPGIRKVDLVKRKNDEEIEEPWVQCDECEGWVHQICGLFNKGRNNNETHYLCPDCLIQGMQRGQRQRIEIRPQSMLEGSDLPHNKLSQYLEHRLYYHLDKERKARAMKEGKLPCEVATAENLTIRVVNSVMKKCEVKPKFHEAFGPEGYPSEFPYRQRVVVLFQKIEGVDVCIFVMYVQEYGQDCAPPNQNCVYLSYLDSVKYFRPEISAVHPLAVPSMYALRTFVYHQILLGYLTYVKMLGFQQMYIWACPPMQGDDYILYCHPNKQKTPRSDRLRHWYLDMLRQAKHEGLVTQLTTLWDAYFPGGKDHRLERCSCAQVPYLEGDYWPGEAENQLANMAEGHRQAGKSSVSKGLGLAAARKGGKGKRYGPGQSTTDEQLMAQLGDILGGNMKEDFIVVHMQEVCTFCRTHILGGQRAFRYKTLNGMPLKCAPDRKFEGLDLKLGPGGHAPSGPITSLTLCENCFSAEHNTWISGARSARLPVNVTPNDLIPEKLEEVQLMKDTDPDVESEFFETRQSFLSLCQGNHYQFDTLRRAKHSSMMVLYHLHNPQAPAFAANCNLCAVEMEPGAGWRCTVCADFDICNKCKLEKGHAHPLQPQVNRKFDETQKRLTDAERRERTEQLQKTMALLVHACSCNNVQCSSSSCRKVRALFQHAVVCQLKVTGGCQMCKKMWFLLNLHAKSCNRSDCPVPRCRELKDLRRKQTARQEEQRRKAYQNMLRNQSQLQAQGK